MARQSRTYVPLIALHRWHIWQWTTYPRIWWFRKALRLIIHLKHAIFASDFYRSIDYRLPVWVVVRIAEDNLVASETVRTTTVLNPDQKRFAGGSKWFDRTHWRGPDSGPIKYTQ